MFYQSSSYTHACRYIQFLHLDNCVFLMLYQVGSDGILTAFSTPAESFAKTIMQTAGELDYGTVFDEAPLLYTPMAYILFILFVVLMPILFSNLLVRL